MIRGDDVVSFDLQEEEELEQLPDLRGTAPLKLSLSGDLGGELLGGGGLS